MRLKKITVSNGFKQHRDSFEANFNKDGAIIEGRNGSGKSTLMCAQLWSLFDKDENLRSNPPVRNMDMEECAPTVVSVFDDNGKELTITKIQKQKKSKPDENGVQKVTLTNTYEVNSIPMTERDMKAKLTEVLGVDTEMLPFFMHSDAVMAEKADKIRKMIMPMGQTAKMSDEKIAKMLGYTELAESLGNYSVDELTAMNKASLKKSEALVADIPNYIIGLEQSKADVDLEAATEARSSAMKAIEELSDKKASMSNKDAIDAAMQSVFDIQFEINDTIRKVTEQFNTAKRRAEEDVYDIHKKRIDKEAEIKFWEISLEQSNERIANCNELISECNAAIKANSKRKFDKTLEFLFDEASWVGITENDKVCPTCGQNLPQKNIDAKVADYNKRKAEAKAQAEAKLAKMKDDFYKSIDDDNASKKEEIKNANDTIALFSEKIKQTIADIAEHKKNLKKLTTESTKLDAKLEEYRNHAVDYTTDTTYKALVAKKKKAEDKLQKLREETINTSEIDAEIEAKKLELDEAIRQIYLAENNAEIDRKIEDWRRNQRDSEQIKANCEKVLYQLDMLSRKKNEILVEKINSHFSIVKWKLFDYLKNGNYKEVCIPTIDGKAFNESMNTGLQVQAKLDICASLQKFYNVDLPIWLDGAECINENNIPDLGRQLIQLRVTDGDFRIR